MKPVLFFCFAFFFIKADAQDTARMRQIDALVANIKTSAYPEQCDTIVKDMSMLGVFTTTYACAIIHNGQLLKFSNKVNGSSIVGGVTTKINGENVFYFDQGKLIKVEEFLVQDDKRGEAEWYFADDAPLYHIIKGGKVNEEVEEKEKDRPQFLLEMSKTFLQIVKKGAEKNAPATSNDKP